MRATTLAVSIVAVIVAILYTESESSTDTDDVLFRKAGEYDLEYARGNILTADLDNDGWVDILTAGGPTRGPYSLSVFFNNGDGTFTQGASYETPGIYMTSADFDRDGDVDLAISTSFFSRQEPNLAIFFNDGEGSFMQAERYHLKLGGDILSGDLDGDGDPDIAVTGGEARIDLFFNDGEGNFPVRGAIDHGIEGEVTIIYYFLLGADFDGDRDLDLVYVADDIGAMSVGYWPEFQVQFNEGQGVFSEPVIYWNRSMGAPFILVEDFNGDGHTDVCVLARFLIPSPFDPILPEKILVFLNRGDGVFGERIEMEGGGIQAVSDLSKETEIRPLFGATGDINLDGSVDLVITSGNFDNAGQVYPFLNRGDGTFVESSGIPAGDHPWIPALADLDNDGDLDLMITDEVTPALKVFFNTTVESQPTYVEDAKDEDRNRQTAGCLMLDQNVPNPFNATTVVYFELPRASRVKLEVYNTSAQKVRTLVDEKQMKQGRHSVRWEGKDQKGQDVASGVYFYHLTAGDFTTTRKMLLLR